MSTKLDQLTSWLKERKITEVECLISDLTGIARGKAGKTREMLQAAALRAMKIPFYLNAVGRPIVTRHSIEGQAIPEDSTATWEPAISHG